MNRSSDNSQSDQGSTNNFTPMNRFRSPEPGVNPLWILLAFIIVGTMIYFGYMHMMERKAVASAAREDADAAREAREMQGYVELAIQAGVL
jgi:hypothetical protein